MAEKGDWEEEEKTGEERKTPKERDPMEGNT